MRVEANLRVGLARLSCAMTQIVLASSPSVDQVASIAAMDNPVLRNLQITECYADLSAAMRARTGDAADWCTFATWASRQAGRTIRGDDFLDALDRILGRRSWVLAPLAPVALAVAEGSVPARDAARSRGGRDSHAV